MPQRDTFAGCHPAVNFLYFALVLAVTMFCLHPAVQLVSLLCALGYALRLSGRKAVSLSLRVLLPMMILAIVVNPAFNHAGTTILTYLPDGNPLTLESILSGFSAAVLLAAAVVWFACYSAVMTSDKFVYLFGRVIPALSLVLSMTLRFVPRFTAQLHTVTQAQRCIGRDVSSGSVLKRMHAAVTIFSILITWSLENAIETADSMKSRGYGLPGRTAFSIYSLDRRDKDLLAWLCICGAYLLCGALCGGLNWRWYPTVKGAPVNALTVSFFLCWLALCMTPLALDLHADRVWNRRQTKEDNPCSHP